MIHIQRIGGLGDVIWAEPVVRHFIERGEVVQMITDFSEIFLNYPSRNLIMNEKFPMNHLRKIHASVERGARWINLDGAYENRPTRHILEAYRLEAGINMELGPPQIHLTVEEKKPLFDNYVVLHIEKNPLSFRNVHGVDWGKVIRYLKERKMEVIQISEKGDCIHGRWVKTKTIREMMSLIYNAKCFIGLDSGPSHIAAALGVPAILFFGSVNPQLRHAKAFKGVFLQAPCEYAHCYHEVVGDSGQPCKWGNGIPKCTIQTSDRVISALETFINPLG